MIGGPGAPEVVFFDQLTAVSMPPTAAADRPTSNAKHPTAVSTLASAQHWASKWLW